MTNQYVNKVGLTDGTTLMDLTGDTVTAAKLFSGYTAHDASGAQIEGTYVEPSAMTSQEITAAVEAGWTGASS